MFAHQLHSHFTTAPEWDVNEFGARGFFHAHGQNLVLLFGAGTAHLHFVGASCLDRRKIVFASFVRRVGVHPQHKLVERHHGDGCHVTPVEWHAGCHRRSEQVAQGHDDLVRVAFRVFHRQKAFGTRTCGFVDHDHGLFHQLVFDDDALDESCHLICTTACACGNNKLNWLGRLPRGVGGSGKCKCGQRCGAKCEVGDRPRKF